MTGEAQIRDRIIYVGKNYAIVFNRAIFFDGFTIYEIEYRDDKKIKLKRESPITIYKTLDDAYKHVKELGEKLA